MANEIETPELVGDLPSISRTVENGQWVKRLETVRDNPGNWFKVYGPTTSPHAIVSNLNSGGASGVDPDEFEFAGRTNKTGEVDEKGKPVREGFVYAMYLENEADRQAKRERLAERQAKREATLEANASTESELV